MSDSDKTKVTPPPWVDKGFGIVAFVALCALIAMGVGVLFFFFVKFGLWLFGV